MGVKFFVCMLVMLSLVNFANAATIYGTIYHLSLKKINNARVEIDTSPKQFLVAQNGTYSFDVPNGKYTIKAQLMQKNDAVASVQENITISQAGIYVLDLILFPDIEEGIENPDIDVNENVVGETGNKGWIFPAGFIVLLVSVIIAGVVYYAKTRRHEEPKAKDKTRNEEDDLGQIIRIIRKEGGRATQKEIRKQIPLSEAKISLMIAELEHKGIIGKIKRGRGNIIILKKK